MSDTPHYTIAGVNRLYRPWADTQKAEGRRDGIVEAARKANLVVAGIKSASQRAAAGKVLRAVERLLPQGSNERQEAYARGLYRRHHA